MQDTLIDVVGYGGEWKATWTGAPAVPLWRERSLVDLTKRLLNAV